MRLSAQAGFHDVEVLVLRPRTAAPGTTVEITLSGSAANVFLLDGSNFSKYKSGRGGYRYFGGQARRSPVHLRVPSNGHWYVVIDLGYAGNVRHSMRILPGAMPAIRTSRAPGLDHIAENIAAFDDDLGQPTRDVDVFLSQPMTKEAIVRPLAAALQQRDVQVWYDEFELPIGDSRRRKIDAGLARARFGVIVLAPSFFEKNWPQYELDGLVTREMTGTQIILPLWHEPKDQLIAHSPSLADKVALRTSDYTIEEIADQIASVVMDEERQAA